jgi:putative peptide zinc metalloprotease protein
MLRSPDRKQACYLRLAPEEYALTRLMDGSRTLARLVAEFAAHLRAVGARAGAPDRGRPGRQPDAGGTAGRRVRAVAAGAAPAVAAAAGPGLLAFAQGRRMVLANVDPVVGFLYKAGGRLLFTRPRRR